MTSINNQEFVIKIGSKGEIFPPKEIRKKLGFTRDQLVIISVVNDQLIIRKLYSMEEILSKDAKVKISHHAFKEMRHKLSKDFEER